ncbi:secretoglobin family 2A member 1-like [Apodemus sylvaticus]|uniref:secretoglobin family 2A member 1-like n=1 Tax=Apodemus sylvaticus TaxID=10129 RepID=UPI0022425528|nr:secretoglobin family 2A member 1-like [Apodemus sylvaticus]
MKLVVLFMLVTIPICCYASGSGCRIIDKIINSTVDPTVSESAYLELLDSYVHDPATENAVKQFKQCFLIQSEETLIDAQVMTDAIYNSKDCPKSS